MKSIQVSSLIALTAGLFAGPALAVPTPDPQTAPPPPPKQADPVCNYKNPDGKQNYGASSGDIAMSQHLLQNEHKTDTCGTRNNKQGECIRVTCKNTTAFYVCNNKPITEAPSCDEVSGMAGNIDNACGGFAQMEGISGFQDSSFGDYRVYVGYGNCNKASTGGPFNQ